jgi:hypothetical protein
MASQTTFEIPEGQSFMLDTDPPATITLLRSQDGRARLRVETAYGVQVILPKLTRRGDTKVDLRPHDRDRARLTRQPV